MPCSNAQQSRLLVGRSIDVYGKDTSVAPALVLLLWFSRVRVPLMRYESFAFRAFKSAMTPIMEALVLAPT